MKEEIKKIYVLYGLSGVRAFLKKEGIKYYVTPFEGDTKKWIEEEELEMGVAELFYAKFWHRDTSGFLFARQLKKISK